MIMTAQFFLPGGFLMNLSVKVKIPKGENSLTQEAPDSSGNQALGRELPLTHICSYELRRLYRHACGAAGHAVRILEADKDAIDSRIKWHGA